MKGFYCSQLVAGAFMYSKVMETKFSSGRYLPGSFSVLKTNNYLALNKGFDFGPEYIIDCTPIL
jgi:hypothetical protein